MQNYLFQKAFEISNKALKNLEYYKDYIWIGGVYEQQAIYFIRTSQINVILEI